jgi:molecular chaperone HtpG
MTTAISQPETFEFKAETRQLLALVIHSLYTRKEISLRELISNASDALDRLQYEALTRPELVDDEAPLAIRLEADQVARTLTIHDNGIGMTREEVIANIGTIARSGTQKLLQQIAEKGRQTLPDLIGRFGVGFYSVFMVADHVSLVTRAAGELNATRWESSGDGHFTVAEDDRRERGTSVTLKLCPVSEDNGVEDYADHWVLSRIVRCYSDFVQYPIILVGAQPDVPLHGDNKERHESVVQDRTLNSGNPIWAKAPADVAEGEYLELYRRIADDWNEPLIRVQAKAEGRFECQALVFVPGHAAPDLYYHAVPFGLRLYAKRVLVSELCSDLLPRYLRFVKGVIDALDLPLNVSRQMLQESHRLAEIRKWVTRKVLDRLTELHEREAETYLKFWVQFGRALKEGFSEDYDNRGRLLRLFFFQSSHHQTNLTTLDHYVERMKPDQTYIYYLTGESREALERAPHVECALARGFEVLYLTDPVDELLMQVLTEHNGRRLKSLGKGTPDWDESDNAVREDLTVEYAALIKRCEESMANHVKRVRLSIRLTTSPACLTGDEYDYSPQMERLLMKGKGGGSRQRRILELNPKHEIIRRLRDRLEQNPEDPEFNDLAELLLGYALVAEGSEPSNPGRFTKALADLLQRTL